MSKIRIGISGGDPNGIGYEIIIKALAGNQLSELCTPIVFANQKILQQCRRTLHADDFNYHQIPSASEAKNGKVNVVDVGREYTAEPGKTSKESGEIAVDSISAAADAYRKGDIDAIVTAPICKKAANSERFPYPGHTEYFNAEFAGEEEKSLMILFNEVLRVALVTTHLPLSKVPEAITQQRVEETIEKFNISLKKDFGIRRPKIAVLGLNPHNGDNGLLGSEEETEISPAIAECRKKDILAFGPMAADGFFGSGAYKHFDGVVAMYHDQGLAPFKVIAGAEGVNFTAGLEPVRTSPDHGTAFDIAWKGEASPESLLQAIYAAIDIVRIRRNNPEQPCITES